MFVSYEKNYIAEPRGDEKLIRTDECKQKDEANTASRAVITENWLAMSEGAFSRGRCCVAV